MNIHSEGKHWKLNKQLPKTGLSVTSHIFILHKTASNDDWSVWCEALSDPYERRETQTDTADQVQTDGYEEEISGVAVQNAKLHKTLLLIF